MESVLAEVNYFDPSENESGTLLKNRESSELHIEPNAVGQAGEVSLGSEWTVSFSTAKVSADKIGDGDGNCALKGMKLCADFKLSENAPDHVNNFSVSLCIKLSPLEGRYILLPSTLYNGNRCIARRTPYSPRIPKDLATPEAPLVINDIFRLGGGTPDMDQKKVQLFARDATIPLVATAVKEGSQRSGFIAELPVGGASANNGTNLIEVAEEDGPGGELLLRFSTPGVREETTYWVTNQQEKVSRDEGRSISQGGSVRLEIVLHSFRDALNPSQILAAVYQRRCQIEMEQRKTQPLRKLCLPLSEAAKLLEDKWNGEWNERMILYPTSGREEDPYYWQAGWCGGLMKPLLILRGSEISRKRAFRELENFFSNAPVTSSSLLLPLAKKEPGQFSTEYEWETREWAQHFRNWTLVRRQADIVYFLTRQLSLFSEFNPAESKDLVKSEWWDIIDACCDAFVKCFEKCGQLGFFLDATTGMVAVGNSTSGGLVPATLVLAHRRNPRRGYLAAAEKIADHLSSSFLDKGFTCGGPGDAMHAPDSESAALLLESLVSLFEETGSLPWLTKAEECARLFSTWVYPYFFSFPPNTSLGRVGAETKGAVFANVQNRHGAPGICTHSGSFLLRLYRATENQTYIDLLSDIAITTSQMVSRPPEEPILNWRGDPQSLGWINERVNTSFWDGPNVGGVHASSSAWCEAALGLAALELPSVYVNKDSQIATCFDHVRVEAVEEGYVTVFNPTKYDAAIAILAEDSAERKKPLVDGYFLQMKRHTVPAGSSSKVAF